MSEGFDVGLEMSGNPAVARQMIDTMAHGGKIAMLGIQSGETGVDWDAVVFKGLNLRGIYGRMFGRDLVQADLDDPERHGHLAGHHAPLFLQGFQQGFDVMRSGNSGKGHPRLERAVSWTRAWPPIFRRWRRLARSRPSATSTGPMDTQVTMAEISGPVLVLSSNNYLGLADHPELIAAGQDALKEFGAGTASVRFICGTFSIHDRIEKALARLSHTEAALTYVSCWTANTGLLPAVAGEGDALVSDELKPRFADRRLPRVEARRLVYKHADMADLDAKLDSVKGARRIFVVTDGRVQHGRRHRAARRHRHAGKESTAPPSCSTIPTAPA